MTPREHDIRYERSAVLLLALGFGLVGLDRWIISPLFPSMMKDLGLNYQDLGNIVGALGLAWGAAALVMGGISDRLGRRKVLVGSLVLFSVCSLLTGFATGLFSLLLVRVIMGITEGAFTPTAVAATAEASRPHRRGLNMGMQQSTFALFGIGLGPIIATQLLLVVPSWHWIFGLLLIPGLVLAYGTLRTIRETDQLPAFESAVPAAPRATSSSTASDAPAVSTPTATDAVRWLDVFRYRNIPLAILGLCGAMTCVFVLSAMVPSYLVDHLGIGTSAMGVIASGIGFGAFAGQLVVPGLSDKFGRKPVAVVALLMAMCMLVAFILQGPVVPLLFVLLFFVAFGAMGCLGLLAGTVAVESVPPRLMAAAAGTVIGVAEIFGGGVAPSVSGFLAQNYGIEYVLYLALGGLLLCVTATSFLTETAPTRAVSPGVDGVGVSAGL
ncbi:MFS transporter [Streptomyces tubercidicus]|uniref:MFS transporter n=1 Tax=Streptomyces tubercidicus TaxID=47759 RepID=UPI002E1639C8|nr:MFS transporter [Streptomyces tubercidicus]WSX23730.1 MFS transporter [Streptomyces tubercidicus]